MYRVQPPPDLTMAHLQKASSMIEEGLQQLSPNVIQSYMPCDEKDMLPLIDFAFKTTSLRLSLSAMAVSLPEPQPYMRQPIPRYGKPVKDALHCGLVAIIPLSILRANIYLNTKKEANTGRALYPSEQESAEIESAHTCLLRHFSDPTASQDMLEQYALMTYGRYSDDPSFEIASAATGPGSRCLPNIRLHSALCRTQDNCRYAMTPVPGLHIFPSFTSRYRLINFVVMQVTPFVILSDPHMYLAQRISDWFLANSL